MISKKEDKKYDRKTLGEVSKNNKEDSRKNFRKTMPANRELFIIIILKKNLIMK